MDSKKDESGQQESSGAFNQTNIAGIDIASFKAPTTLTKWLKALLVIGIILAAAAVYSGWRQYLFLNAVKNSAYSSEEQLNADAQANDLRQSIIGLSQVAIFITTLVFFFIWVHRANYNARKLGVQNMKFTPGWSVGWYFIPIANLWKPYQAMKEVWNGSNAFNKSGGFILGLWWLLWIVSGMFSKASFRLSLRAKELDELISSTSVTITSDFVDVLSGIATLILISSIFAMQMSHLRRLQTDTIDTLRP